MRWVAYGWEVYEVAGCTISWIIRKFCKLVKLHLQKNIIQIPNEHWFRILAKEFERLRNVPYIIRDIDGSHIFMLAPVISGDDYYCCKYYHTTLL